MDWPWLTSKMGIWSTTSTVEPIKRAHTRTCRDITNPNKSNLRVLAVDCSSGYRMNKFYDMADIYPPAIKRSKGKPTIYRLFCIHVANSRIMTDYESPWKLLKIPKSQLTLPHICQFLWLLGGHGYLIPNGPGSPAYPRCPCQDRHGICQNP